MKTFLAAGEYLINPALLAYAVTETDSEGLQLRLGFAGSVGAAPVEVLLKGLEARSVLRWLRTHAEFLDAGSPSIRRDCTPSPTGPKIRTSAQRPGRNLTPAAGPETRTRRSTRTADKC
jgi:hypothetical protein